MDDKTLTNMTREMIKISSKHHSALAAQDRAFSKLDSSDMYYDNEIDTEEVIDTQTKEKVDNTLLEIKQSDINNALNAVKNIIG